MLLFYKNKGILVPLYLVVSFIVTAMIIGALGRNVGGLFAKTDFYSTLGISLLIAAGWTYLTQYDYYMDKEGNKKRMDTVNALFFIKMGAWVYIFITLAIVFLGNSCFHYFKNIS